MGITREEFVKAYPDIKIVDEVKLPDNEGYFVLKRCESLITYPFISDVSLYKMAEGLALDEAKEQVRIDFDKVVKELKLYLSKWYYKHGVHRYENTSGWASPGIWARDGQTDFYIDK